MGQDARFQVQSVSNHAWLFDGKCSCSHYFSRWICRVEKETYLRRRADIVLGFRHDSCSRP